MTKHLLTKTVAELETNQPVTYNNQRVREKEGEEHLKQMV